MREQISSIGSKAPVFTLPRRKQPPLAESAHANFRGLEINLDRVYPRRGVWFSFARLGPSRP